MTNISSSKSRLYTLSTVPTGNIPRNDGLLRRCAGACRAISKEGTSCLHAGHGASLTVFEEITPRSFGGIRLFFRCKSKFP